MGKVNPFYLKGLSKKDKKKHQKYILDRRRKAEKGKYISKINENLIK